MSNQRCIRQPLGGGQCEREAGHEGNHRKSMWSYDPHGVRSPELSGFFEWDDESQRRLADKHGSGFD